jgi:hypothetical protein
MTDEDVIDCIMEVDEVLSSVESLLNSKKYKQAYDKLKEARATIEELRQEHCAADTQEVEMNIMNELK